MSVYSGPEIIFKLIFLLKHLLRNEIKLCCDNQNKVTNADEVCQDIV